MPTLQSIFDRLLEGETVVIEHFDKRDYDSTVVAVRRKFRLYCRLFLDIGAPNPYEGQYVKILFDRELVRGTYSLAPVEDKTNVRKEYRAVEL